MPEARALTFLKMLALALMLAPTFPSALAAALRCVALRTIRDDIEKEHAFKGLCSMIRLNPRAPLNSMAALCDALASWSRPPDELNEEFKHILEGYKNGIPAEQWATFYATLPPDLRSRLSERYGL